MKRFLVMFLVLGLSAGSVATAEAKKAQPQRLERTVERSYGPYPFPVVTIPTRSTENSFTAKVTDAHGQPVFVEVYASTENGRHIESIGRFCGETTRPLRFLPGSKLKFYLSTPLWPFDIRPDCPANRIKTTGSISVTLSDLP